MLIEGMKKRTLLIILPIYMIAIIFFDVKMAYYSNYVGRFPDEAAHISYVAYLECHGDVIPQLKNMTLLTASNASSTKSDAFTTLQGYDGTLTFSSAFNYLCHPPLYYQIMRLSGGIHVTGKNTFTVDLMRLRVFTMSLATLAMLLILYIGLSRIGKNPIFHLTYAVICVSVPMLAYTCAGVNNDTLSLLAFTIYTLGLIRFSEKRRNACTYLLIGSGFYLSFLSKLTAGMIVTISLALFVLYFLIKERNARFLLTKQFLATTPFYLLTAAYYLIIHVQTGSFQPSYITLDPKQYFASAHYTPQYKGTMLFRNYIPYFFDHFMLTWTGIASHISLVKGANLFDISQIALVLVLLLPVLLYLVLLSRRKISPVIPAVGVIYPAIVVTIFTQFLREYGEFKQMGFTGGYQSRYYLCTIAAVALACVFALKNLSRRNRKSGDIQAVRRPASTALVIQYAAVNLFCVAFSALLVYEDFIYFVLNFTKYLK